MSEKFNKGDRVRRIEGCHNGMDIGDEAIVTGYSKYGGVSLCGLGLGHTEGNLELVSSTKYEMFKIGVKIKLEYYGEYIDHERHSDEIAEVTEVSSEYLRVIWMDKRTSQVFFDKKSNPYIVDELKNNKMDMNEIKNLDKDVLKKAKANVLKARKEMQTERAEAILTELFNIKDAVEEKIGEDQEVLNSVTEDIKVFDVKGR